MDELILNYETERKKKAKVARLYILFCVIGFVVSLTFCILSSFMFDYHTALGIGSVVLCITSLVLGIVMLIKTIVMTTKWKRYFADVILLQLIEGIYPDYKFDPFGGISQKVLMEPKFFMKPDRYTYGNYLEATYGTTSFSMSDYNLERLHSDSKGHTYYATYAKGRFFLFTFERDFENIVKVVEKTLFSRLNFTGLDKVELESVDFNKKFMTVASDQMAAFYILTPQVQEQMMKLESMFGGKIYFCFMNNHLYIAVDDSKSSFKFGLFTPLTNAGMNGIVEELSIPKYFIDSLKLNREKYNRDTTMGGI